MRDRDVLEIVGCLGVAGVRAWLDGGWGVDALIRRQTRDHDDLDLLIQLSESDVARRTLTTLGLDLTEDETTLCFVARDADDRRVDVHTVTFDDATMGAGHSNARRTAPTGATRRRVSRDSGWWAVAG